MTTRTGTSSILTRSLLVAAGAALVLLAATQVPLVPAAAEAPGAARLVPLDTWAASRFPGARDLYRQYVAALFQPRRLPLLGLFVGLLAASALSYPQRLGAWLARRVPPLSARGLGLYRCALGLAMLVALRSEIPPGVIPLDVQRSAGWLAQQDGIRQLAATPGAAVWIWQATSAGLVAFALGLWPRLALTITSALMTLFVGIVLTSKSTHDWGIPLITLWTLVLVPWRDSEGLQTAFARWRGRTIPGVPATGRGLALWLPGLTIGLAFAAAAFAKLDTSGLGWISGGAVRFHFIEDARQAPVDWGLLLTRSDAAAVALSLAAVTVEGGFWLVTLVRHAAIRALFGLAGLAMLLGFYLFQGVFWPGWWALFLAFAPWPLVDRQTVQPAAGGVMGTAQGPASTPVSTAVPPARAAVPPFATAFIVVLVLQQVAVSALRIESEPFVSDYSMYSYTWPSKAAFDEHLASKTARYELWVNGISAEAFEDRLRQVPAAFDVLVDAIGRTARHEPWPGAARAKMTAVRQEYHRQFGEPLSRVDVRVLERGFDWQHGTFDQSLRVALQGVLDLDAERFDGTP